MPRILFTLALMVTMVNQAAQASGNAEAGKVKAYTCTGCHGIPGYKNTYPMYQVPKLGGQNLEYLVSALNSYRTGERKHPTMNLQAESLTDEDINDIAAWLSSLGGQTQEPHNE